jgi:hypothetical protein
MIKHCRANRRIANLDKLLAATDPIYSTVQLWTKVPGRLTITVEASRM